MSRCLVNRKIENDRRIVYIEQWTAPAIENLFIGEQYKILWTIRNFSEMFSEVLNSYFTKDHKKNTILDLEMVELTPISS